MPNLLCYSTIALVRLKLLADHGRADEASSAIWSAAACFCTSKNDGKSASRVMSLGSCNTHEASAICHTPDMSHASRHLTLGTALTANLKTSDPFMLIFLNVPDEEACPLLSALLPSPLNNACTWMDKSLTFLSQAPVHQELARPADARKACL